MPSAVANTAVMTWAPEKYILGDDDAARGKVSMRLSASVPVVDLGRIGDGDGDELEKLRRACAEWGMFHMVNHGISVELTEELRRVGREFFERGDEEMQAERSRISAAKRGDMQGYGQTYAVAHSRQLDWGDLLSLDMWPAPRRDYSAWPATPPEFRGAVEDYGAAVVAVARRVVAAMARAAALSPDEMLRAFGLLDDGDGDGEGCAAFVKMRMNMYPACEWAERVNGLSPHADMAGVTVLLQDEHEVGLHWLHDGEWVGVPPLPGALVVMVGNMMEVLSNAVFRSVVHRGVPNRRSDRMSVPFFLSPPLDSLVSPLLVPDAGAVPLFRPFLHREYVQFYLSRRAVEGKSSFYSFAALPDHPCYSSSAAADFEPWRIRESHKI